MTAFEEFGVLHDIATAVEELEWNLPTDIQAEAIPAILGGGDVLMAAETGSGKTGAFCLPILQIVWETIKDWQTGKADHDVEVVSKIGNKLLHMASRDNTIIASGTMNWVMSSVDRDPELAINPEGTTCQSRNQQGWQGCRATKGAVNAGKYYYEAIVTDEGLCRVGWSTSAASRDLGTDKFGYGFGGTGKKSNNRQFDDYGESYGKGDVIGCFLDLDIGEIKFAKNGKVFSKAFTLTFRNQPLFPAVVLKNAEMHFNFGDQPFKFNPTGGFVGLSNANPEYVVKNESVSKLHVTIKPRAPNAPLAVVIEPSRELAEQTLAEIKRFKKHLNNPSIKELLLVGGVNSRDQADALRAGVDVVVGTPGRLEDLVSSGDLSLESVRFFVLDEADGLLTQGHNALINRFYQRIPKISPDGKRLQIIVCSATLHNFDVKKLADKIMHFPTWIDLKGQDSVPDTVHHVQVKVDPKADSSWRTLQRFIRTDGVHANDRISFESTSPEILSEGVKMLKGEYVLAAIRKFKMDKCLIFCRTKLDCDNLEDYMLQNGNKEFSCVCLHSDKRPDERNRNLQMFKDGKVKFIICTDVAARGLDIRGLPFVINVTLPDVTNNYIHRIGRVGRADRMGLAITLASTVPEKVWYHSCQNKSCHNTMLKEQGGCCMWYNEQSLLGEIEEHLGITIPLVGKDMNVPVDEFEGKVVYGEKRKKTGTGYEDHVGLLQTTVGQLADLEKRAQTSFLKMRFDKNWVA